MATTDEPNSGRSTTHRNDPVIGRFMRVASEAEKLEYSAIQGPGSMVKKRKFREMINEQKLVNCTARQTNTTASAQADTKVGTYRNFWSIAEKEGGLMDRDFGVRVATSICTLCEKKGPPALMWDSVGSVMKYLHCEVGISDIQSKTRSSILSADLDMDEDVVRQAMQMGVAEGLSPQIPAAELNHFTKPVQIATNIVDLTTLPNLAVEQPRIENFFRPTAPLMDEATSQATVQAPVQAIVQAQVQEPVPLVSPVKSDAIAGVNFADFAKQLLSKGSDSSSSSSLLSAVLLQSIISSNADGKDNENGKDKDKDKDKDKPKDKAGPKVKTPAAKYWQECSALGRKLDGMTTHADSVVQQTKEKDNNWSWAMNTQHLADLAAVIADVAPVVHTWSSSIRTSTLGFMIKKEGAEEATKWLHAHREAIKQATDQIELPLGLIVGMHAAMLKTRASEGKPKKAAKQ
jgi:hypothetical protein